MKYSDSYLNLKSKFKADSPVLEFNNIEINKFNFTSNNQDILPGKDKYHCKIHDVYFNDFTTHYNDIGDTKHDVYLKDFIIEENKDFKYYVMIPKNVTKTKKVTFLFHGFNEKSWEKYLPWAEYICEETGGAVILFPIAFHMDRAPINWSEKRSMFRLSKERIEQFPNIVGSTLSNVAISMRMHVMPQRFIWSGLQTYYDIIQLIESFKMGENELIDKDFSFNIFAYSIGGFLAEILKLSNYKNYFNETKVCLFCSGAVFDKISPISKVILDSEAFSAVRSYLVDNMGKTLKENVLLNHYLGEHHVEGKFFHSLFEYNGMLDFRENILRAKASDFYAISLKEDKVMPSKHIMKTLRGSNDDIGIKVDEFDFPYKYSHEMPFPFVGVDSELVDTNFNNVFERVCNFFSIVG